ncbi:hypothetical protein [Enterobacter asburiae]
MELYKTLLKDFEKHVYLYDVNNRMIAYGKAIKLFDVLGDYFLNLKVIRIDDVDDDNCNIVIDTKLGGNK